MKTDEGTHIEVGWRTNSSNKKTSKDEEW